jgi:hypothetical protein
MNQRQPSTVDAGNAESLLMQYSEWLDVQGCLADLGADASGLGTHEQLVREFIAQRNLRALPRVIA